MDTIYKTGVIYIIKNNCNDKVYIGQTLNLNERWKQHKTAANREYNINNKYSILYPAMRKYGIKNFYIEVIEDNIPSDQLNQREKYWIEQYNSVRPNGYNILAGGEIGEQFKRPIYQLDIKTLEIINSFNSIVEASNITGVYITGIHRVLRNTLLTAGGYKWCYQEKYEEYKNNPPTKTNGTNVKYETKQTSTSGSGRCAHKIVQINKETNEIIKEWTSVKEAATYFSCSTKTLYKALNKEGATSQGFVWKYTN